jgi:hypothetical protein
MGRFPPKQRDSRGDVGGSRFDPNRPSRDVIDLFRRVEKQIDKDSFETEDQRVEFVEGVFTGEILSDPVRLCKDVLCSRVIEKLLQASTFSILRRTMHALRGAYADLAFHKYGSHVLERLVSSIPFFPVLDEGSEGEESSSTVGTDDLPSPRALLTEIVKELSVRFGDLVFDTYGSFSVRFLISILGGKDPKSGSGDGGKKKKKKGGKGGKGVTRWMQQRERPVFRELWSLLSNLPQFEDDVNGYLLNPCASPVVQRILECFQGCEEHKDLTRAILSGGFTEEEDQIQHFVQLTQHRYGSHVAETVTKVVAEMDSQSGYLPLSFAKLLKTRFLPYVGDMAVHGCANFVLQAGLDGMRADPSHVSMVPLILKGLERRLTSVVESNATSVILKLVEMCGRLHAGEDILVHLLHSEMCSSVEENDDYFLENMTKEHGNLGWEISTTIFSCFSEKLQRKLASRWIHQFHSMSEDDIVHHMQDRATSICIESFLSSASIPFSTKQKWIKKPFLHHLVPRIVEIASNAVASRVLEAAFAHMRLEQRIQITQALLENEADVVSVPCGRFVFRNLDLATFRRSRTEWENAQQKGVKQTKMVEEILGDDKVLDVKRPLPVETDLIEEKVDDCDEKDGAKKKKKEKREKKRERENGKEKRKKKGVKKRKVSEE